VAHYRHKDGLPKIVASAAIPRNRPVKDLAGTADKVLPAATNIDHVLGFSIATGATAGEAITVVTEGIVKAHAVASLGAGGEVGIASTNGGLGPIAGASGFTRFAVGIAQANAAAGDTFSVLLRVRQISGAI